MRALLVPSVALLGLTACLTPITSGTTSSSTECTIDATLSVSEAAPGDVVTITGGPLSGPDDTVVRVSGVTAELSEVAACTLCDACVSEQASCPCGTCEVCEAACADCAETVDFYVPDLPSGTAPVVLINKYGATQGLSLDVIAADSDSL